MKTELNGLNRLGLVNHNTAAHESPRLGCFQDGDFTRLRVSRRGESCVKTPHNEEYLIVVEVMGDNGDWIPIRSVVADSFAELKRAVEGIAADSDGLIVEASCQFERLAFELGLRHIKSEWGNV